MAVPDGAGTLDFAKARPGPRPGMDPAEREALAAEARRLYAELGHWGKVGRRLGYSASHIATVAAGFRTSAERAEAAALRRSQTA